MKFVAVRELRIRPGQVWKQLKKEQEIIVTSNGKPFALLTGIEEETIESSLYALRQSKALLAMEAIQRCAVEKGLNRLSHNEIEAEIKATRKARKK